MLFKRISRHIAKNQFGIFLKPFFQTKLLENECKLVTLYALSYRTYINLIATFITDTFRHEDRTISAIRLFETKKYVFKCTS